MKKIFAICAAIMCLMMSAQVRAAQFQISRPPLKIDFFSDSCQIGGNEMKPADVVKLAPGFYFHYDIEKNFGRLGDFDVSNSVAVDMLGPNELTVVENLDKDGTYFFLLKKVTPPGDDIKVLGKRNGQWIEYFNVQSLRTKYDLGWNLVMSEIIARADKIIFRYTLREYIFDVICTWDTTNQNFSAEMIKR